MDKSIGFEIDQEHTVACVVQAGQSDRYLLSESTPGKPLSTPKMVTRH